MSSVVFKHRAPVSFSEDVPDLKFGKISLCKDWAASKVVDGRRTAKPRTGMNATTLASALNVTASDKTVEKDKGIEPIFPGEIMSKIIKFAMTADGGGRVQMPCLTSREFTPNIAVGLMRVSRQIYHEATLALYSENQFIFDYLGSDLRTFDKPNMISSCLVGHCRYASETPYFKAVRFELGSYVDPYTGMVTLKAFTKSLYRLRRNFVIEKLTIHFHQHAYIDREGLNDLAAGLRGGGGLTVSRVLTVTGPANHHDDVAVHEIAAMFGMKPKPTSAFVLESSLDCGFSYHRFISAKTKVPDYDLHEAKEIQHAAIRGGYCKKFDMWV